MARRPVTTADRTAIQSYRSGRKTPIFSTSFSELAELGADWNPVSDDNQWGDFGLQQTHADWATG